MVIVGEENEEVRDEMVEYSCGEMAALVRRWLLKKHNFKVRTYSGGKSDDGDARISQYHRH